MPDSVKKPFSDMIYSDMAPVLRKWQEEHSEATVHGWKCKLKAFLRWGSGNKNDPRIEKIRSGSYVSPVTLRDLLTDEEINKVRKVARSSPRDLAMVDFHILWGPCSSESAALKLKDVEITDRYIVINIFFPYSTTSKG